MKRLFSLVVIIVLFFTFCEKEEEIDIKTNKLEFASFAVINISYTSAKVSSAIQAIDNVHIDECGHCWAFDSLPDIDDSCSVFTNYSSNSFTSELLGLKHNKTYYIRAYFKTGNVINYSKEISFKTLEIKIPVVKTRDIINIRAKTAESGGKVLIDNGGEVVSRGVCWNTTGNPTIEDSLSIDSLGLGEYKSNLKNLEIGVKYYIRAYAINEIGTGYGDIVSFTTKDGIPEISTQETTNITAIAAESGINISDDGGLDILEKGICYNKIGLPTVKDSTLFGGSGTDSFDGVLENLDVNTTYYIRSFAINEIDTIYGNEISFTTKDGIPEISTQEVTNLTAIGAESGIDITDDGGLDIKEKGVCYSMSGSPTLKDIAIYGGSGIDNYKAILENLNINTTYYIRSFAINALDTIYGNEISFTTKDGIPEISTKEITNLTATGAESGIVIIDDEGLEIIEKGVCYNKSGLPTLKDSTFYGGSGSESYDVVLGNLDIHTTYYIRSFSINALDTAFGNELTFTTKDGVLDVSTSEITDIESTTAKGGGQVLDDEGLSITERGLCWNLSGSPTISDQFNPSGDGEGSFASNIKDLEISTNYYVRAYAKNEVGVSYGNEVSFITHNGIPVIHTTKLSEITFTSVKTGGEVVTDEGFEITEKGVCWNTNGNPTVSDSKIIEGSVANSFVITIDNLTEGETYYFKAYAINEIGVGYGEQLGVSLTENNLSVQDIDGNWYDVIKIGNQIWLRENLKTTRYQNGDEIGTTIPVDLDISEETNPKYQWCYNGDESNLETYGRLYTSYVAKDTRNVCPSGWHVPSTYEFDILMSYLIENGYNYGGSTSGNKLAKSIASITNWNSYTHVEGVPGNNPETNNSSGFTGQPSGARVNFESVFTSQGVYTYWWSNDETAEGLAIAFGIENFVEIANLWTIGDINTGAPIRCIKD